MKLSLFSSITFWTAVAALIPLAAIAMQYYQSIDPRRLIFAQLFLNPSNDMPQEEKKDATGSRFYVYARSKPGTYIRTIVLAGGGKRDIPRDAFDLEKPIMVDVGTPILAVLGRSTPKWAEPPASRIDGQYLKIGPGLIGKQQSIFYLILIADKEREVSFLAALTDVTVSSWGRISFIAWLLLRPLIRGYMFLLIPVGGLAVLLTWLNTESVHDVYVTTLIAIYTTFIVASALGLPRLIRGGFKFTFLLPEDNSIACAEEDNTRAAKTNGSAQDVEPLNPAT